MMLKSLLDNFRLLSQPIFLELYPGIQPDNSLIGAPLFLGFLLEADSVAMDVVEA